MFWRTHLEVRLQNIFNNNNFYLISGSFGNTDSVSQKTVACVILCSCLKSFPENEFIVDEQVESDAPKTALRYTPAIPGPTSANMYKDK